jgi:ABC-type sugar transport system permease subunit
MSGPTSRGNPAWTALLFLSPALLLLGLFVIWPLLRAVLWSFHGTDLLQPEAAGWVALSNYSDLLSDPRFRTAFFNTALFVMMVVPLQTLAAFFLALLVNRPQRYWRWLRSVFYLSLAVSMPVLAVVWTMLYQPVHGTQMGLVNAFIETLGFEPQAWLRSPGLALPAIAFMSIWQGLGLQMMVFVAGLQNLSTAQLEAARLDGANAFQRLIYVILPGMKNSITFNLTVTTILAFRLFVQPYLMTRGGPEDRTLSVLQWIYEATFYQHDLGRACAAALLFLLLVGAIVLVSRMLSREERA